MSNLPNKIRLYLDREVDFRKDVIVQDDGQGQYIKEWNVSETKPTDAQLNALSSQATVLENNAIADANRKAEFKSVEFQLDYIYHNGISKWKTDHIKPIKDKYPKE